MLNLNLFLLGAISLSCLVAGLFFMQFWKQTQDRLFLLFGFSFLLEGINRAAIALSNNPREGEPLFYLVRLFSFCLILTAIVHKNTQQTKSSDASTK